MKKNILLILGMFVFISINAQQSTTGKYRPANIDAGLSVATKTQVVISDVPIYIWHHGCGPTALGMVVGYYDAKGYSDLIDGDASIQGSNTNDAMANNEHYNDYSLPIDYYPDLYQDKSELGGAHADNCMADFMETSFSSESNRYGWSWSNKIDDAFYYYAQMKNSSYTINSSYDYFSAFSWVNYKNEIDANRPVVLLVDTDGDGSTDHFVTGIGYDNSNSNYAIYDTWDSQIHWYPWQEVASGNTWGIYGFNIFVLSNPSPTEECNNELSVNIYPNPTNELINIQTNGLSNYDKIDIEIYDMVGKKVYEIHNQSTSKNLITFNLPDNISGIFYLHILSDGQKIVSEIVVVEK